jgi:hypothetical protein
MSVDYFWALSLRCSKAASATFDIEAQREFRQLAEEFSAKANQLEAARVTRVRPASPFNSADRIVQSTR